MSTSRSRRGRSEGSIYQRPDGLWVVSVSLGIHGGRRVRRVAYGKTKKEAHEKLQNLRLQSGTGAEVWQMQLAEWLHRWLKLIEPNVEPGTLVPYRRHCVKHIIPRIGGAKVQKLRPMDVEALYAELLKAGHSAALVRKIGTTLTVALNHAVTSQVITANPATTVRKPKASRPIVEVLDVGQANQLIAACAGMPLGTAFILILDSGIRPGECLALTWKDVDFAGKRISVTKSLEQSGRIKRPKTPKSIRQLDLTPATMDELNRHRKAMLAAGADVRSGPVFLDDEGSAPLPGSLQRKYLLPILAKAGLPSYGVYALRHTCATVLLAAGVNPKIVSERLGHSTITLTLDSYSHILPGMQKVATDALAAAFSR